jgi:hypothetical protein
MPPASQSKKVAWNRGLIVGQKRAFSVGDLAEIEARLIAQASLHDLALLSFGLDTMLRSNDRAQLLSQAFFGAMAGYNGELLDQSDLGRIPYLMQFQNEKGDAVIGDVNPDQMRADYRRQGVLNKDGTLNWDRFAAMIETNRNGLYTSEQNYGQTVQSEAE